MNPFIQNKKQVSIFVTAGFPEINSLTEQIRYLQEKGIDFIEVGIPFSDPMADGPVIQETSSIALANGMELQLIFDQIHSLHSEIKIPLVLMGYLNPVLQFGLEKFLINCQKLNIKSLILPDLSVELYETKYASLFEKYQVPVTFLVTPETPNSRIQRIAKVCSSSFVYLVGQNSITGAGYEMDAHKINRYAEIKQLCGTTPLFLGFGIDSKSKKEQGFEQCDGVIVGTAYLKALKSETQDRFLVDLL